MTNRSSNKYMSPRSASQFEEMREQSTKKILDAALQLFANEGYHATSVSKIAKQAGVSKGLMYNYYHSKEDLLKAIIHQAIKQGEEAISELMQAKTAQEKLEFIINYSFSWFTEHEQYAKMIMSLSIQIGQFPYVKEMIQSKIDGQYSFLTQIFADLGYNQPEMEAKAIAALLDGAALQSISVGELLNLQELKEFLINKYCKNKPK